MKAFLPDANVLIYAFQPTAPHHRTCRSWLRSEMKKGSEILVTELTEVALLRISTHPKVYRSDLVETLGFWADDLWRHARTRRIAPAPTHNQLLRDLLSEFGLIGDDVNDAWLAALAIGHRATLVSADQGFKRFPGLSWLDPSA